MGPQPFYLENIYIYIYIKNGFHGTIYIFKNYFATMFSIFNKINYIQTLSQNCEATSLRNLCESKKKRPKHWRKRKKDKRNKERELLGGVWLRLDIEAGPT